jgi:DNA-directed RNA polymerase beta subunit
MPQSKDGTFIPDVCLNGLGVIGRLNLGQKYEMELTHYSDLIIERFKKDKKKLFSALMEFLSITSPEQHKFLKSKLLTKALQDEYVQESIDNGLMIHQPPFFDNITVDKMLLLIEKFDIKLKKFKGIKNELVAGTMYFIKLKHEPYGKLSIRSAGPISLLNVPYKNNESFKKSNALYSNAAIRFGEMETINMMLTKDPETVGKFIRAYSSSEQARQFMIQKLINTDIDSIDSVIDDLVPESKSNTSETFKALLAGTGINFIETDSKVKK